MKLEEQKHVQGTSREDEEKHLKETLDVIHANMDSYGRQVREMKENIDEMLEHYHDNDAEVYVILNNTITLHDHMKRALERNERAANKPYFGRICFHDEALGKEESLYIGKGGISRDSTHQEVIDWRAPVANAYYENGLGRCSYPSPGGAPLWIDLRLKRTYEIEQGKLLDYFDSEVISNDDLLTKYLAKNKQAVLGEIVATIQKEQNDIIRKSPYHNMIVQGVAGSGKTTVAMHRISFILYNYAERFQPRDFYIVGSNRILLNYITGVLPSLDVRGVHQMTMEQLFVRLLYEDWDGKKYHIRKKAQNADSGNIKGTDGWFHALERFCDRLERDMISTKSIYLNPRQFVEGIENGRSGIYDRSGGETPDESALILLMDGQAVERYIRQNPHVSIQSKINMLNERLLTRVKDEFLGKGIKYTEAERKAILKAYRNRYGGRNWKRSTYRLYDDFLKEQASLPANSETIDHLQTKAPGCSPDADMPITLPGNEFDIYDLAALAYIYKRTKETDVISEAHHIVIDEAQDFGMMVYHCLHFCIKDCTYTIMGDVSQNIRFGFGLNDWEDLRKLLLDNDPMSSFGVLKKSYRNTVEISHFATDILHHGQSVRYPVEPIIRHGEPVTVQSVPDGDALWQAVVQKCHEWQEKDLPTIAVICRDRESADKAAGELGKRIEIMETDPEKAEFGNGIIVLPVEYTKGLEFDAVLILNPTREEYPVDDGHAKLLYVAATRALHELCVLHTGNLTRLIADPVPEAAEMMPGEAVPQEKAVSENFIQRNVPSGNPGNKDASGRTHGNAYNTRKPRPVAASPENIPEMRAASPAASVMQVYRNNRQRQQPRYKPRENKAAENDRFGQNVSTSQQVQNAPSKDSDHAGQSDPTDACTRQSPESHFPATNVTAISSQNGYPDFGDFPPTEKLRPAGHARIDLAVRWVMKQPDGLYLQSRYGILRLSPVGSGIVRITFAKGGKLLDGIHPQIKVDRLEKFWLYKESGQTVTFSTDELILQADKSTGAIRYLDHNKKLLLAERNRECRQQEPIPGGGLQSWLFLEPARKEQLFAIGPSGTKALSLRRTARYISAMDELPFLFSNQGYGILVASDAPVIYCDLPTYGTYLHTEKEVQMDYYFIAGKNPDMLMNACQFLKGEL
ncbi:MAG: AAA family ATPase [Lachnospiraceae bacterium]|nr:AAA family ATPase [Lachnospiraceae bacterium]MCM1238734.1 AAA family ATPase [Lachnospiraceae bacterium]